MTNTLHLFGHQKDVSFSIPKTNFTQLSLNNVTQKVHPNTLSSSKVSSSEQHSLHWQWCMVVSKSGAEMASLDPEACELKGKVFCTLGSPYKMVRQRYSNCRNYPYLWRWKIVHICHFCSDSQIPFGIYW